MLGIAILLIIIIVIGTACLITKEANSANTNKKYGRIIAPALLTILVIVVLVGYLFITYFK